MTLKHTGRSLFPSQSSVSCPYEQRIIWRAKFCLQSSTDRLLWGDFKCLKSIDVARRGLVDRRREAGPGRAETPHPSKLGTCTKLKRPPKHDYKLWNHTAVRATCLIPWWHNKAEWSTKSLGWKSRKPKTVQRLPNKESTVFLRTNDRIEEV